MPTIETLKDEIAINDALGGVARLMLETARKWLDEAEFSEIDQAEFAAIEVEMDRLEQRQRGRRRLIGEEA